LGTTPSPTSASSIIPAIPSAPDGVRWIPSGCSQDGFWRAIPSQSSTEISGYFFAAATIMPFMST
jgi:hypothetical protein